MEIELKNRAQGSKIQRTATLKRWEEVREENKREKLSKVRRDSE